MGNFSAQKGLIVLFELLDIFAARYTGKWELQLAGEPQDEAGAELWRRIQHRFSGNAWWHRINHVGWIDSPRDFLGSLDLFLFTSPQFDSLPTVLLEAAQCGTPVLAARVGGVEEVVQHGRTGWLFPANDTHAGAQQLLDAVKQSGRRQKLGQAAATRIAEDFSIERMTRQYLDIYRKALRTGQ